MKFEKIEKFAEKGKYEKLIGIADGKDLKWQRLQ